VTVDIQRAAVDRFIKSAFYRGGADAANAGISAQALSRVEASLGAPGENISYANALDDAFAALTALAANPSSLAAKADALAALDAAFRSFGRTLDAIATEVDAAGARLSADIERANALLEDVFRLNAVAPDSPGAADLLDARLSELSRLLSISVARNDLGQVTVSAADGTILAGPGGHSALGAGAGSPTLLTLSAVDPATGGLTLIDPDFGGGLGGEIGGLLDLINVELPALDALVRSVAQGVADDLNAAYAQNAVVGSNTPTTDPLIIVDANGRLAVNAVLMSDPARFAIARPQSGAAAGLNDGAGATALAFIGSGASMRAASQSVAQIGSQARNAELRADTTGAVSNELAARVSAEGGVNLDEELSNLILYQRAYGANARVIAAVDEMWRTLLDRI
jgi:flagellar hook-associated protein 1 FlgK